MTGSTASAMREMIAPISKLGFGDGGAARLFADADDDDGTEEAHD